MSQLVIMCGFMQAQKESHQKANSRSLNKLDYLICYKAKQSLNTSGHCPTVKIDVKSYRDGDYCPMTS